MSKEEKQELLAMLNRWLANSDPDNYDVEDTRIVDLIHSIAEGDL